MALEVPMPLIEIDWAMNKIIATLQVLLGFLHSLTDAQEYEQNNAVRADEAEKMAQKFVGSCEMVFMCIKVAHSCFWQLRNVGQSAVLEVSRKGKINAKTCRRCLQGIKKPSTVR